MDMDAGTAQVVMTTLLTMGSGISGWAVGRRKRHNDFLTEQQESIELLTESNKRMVARFTEVVAEVVELRNENTSLRCEMNRVKQELEVLSSEHRRMKHTVAELQCRVNEWRRV